MRHFSKQKDLDAPIEATAEQKRGIQDRRDIIKKQDALKLADDRREKEDI